MFLGPKDDLENVDSKKLLKAANAYSKTLENQLKKYYENVYVYIDLMDVGERSEYITKKRERLHVIVSKFK